MYFTILRMTSIVSHMHHANVCMLSCTRWEILFEFAISTASTAAGQYTYVGICMYVCLNLCMYVYMGMLTCDTCVSKGVFTHLKRIRRDCIDAWIQGKETSIYYVCTYVCMEAILNKCLRFMLLWQHVCMYVNNYDCLYVCTRFL